MEDDFSTLMDDVFLPPIRGRAERNFDNPQVDPAPLADDLCRVIIHFENLGYQNNGTLIMDRAEERKLLKGIVSLRTVPIQFHLRWVQLCNLHAIRGYEVKSVTSGLRAKSADAPYFSKIVAVFAIVPKDLAMLVKLGDEKPERFFHP